jgi:hypothetical protein
MRRGIAGTLGIVAALVFGGAGCAHNATSPTLHRTIHAGATVLVVTPLVTVTKGVAYDVDARASRAASENVGRAAPSGEVIYHDGLRQGGVWFLADADDAFGFVAELASDLPKGR